jgi:hypothetical protein
MLPNFLIIGAPRSGTTHLYRGLRQHPAIFMSDFKEPMFFAYEGEDRPGSITNRAAYETLFHGSEPYPAVGEASTLYLYSPNAARRIRQSIPDVRLIAILRNPTDRAFSQYTFQRFLQTEPLDTFEAALADENNRIQNNASPFLLYRPVGLYGRQIPRYLDQFPKEQLLFVLQDDLDIQPQTIFQQIFSFIGVDPNFEPDLRHRTNASGVPQYDTLFRMMKTTGRAIKKLIPERLATRLSGSAHDAFLSHPALTPETRQTLNDYFAKDIAITEGLIERDLSHWLS